MPRGKSVNIEEKIAVAQEQVIKAKARYDKACRELENLIAKRDAARRDELWKAVVASDRSYEEVVAWVTAGKQGS